MVKNNYILSVLKGVVISLLFAIIAILLFSVILRIFSDICHLLPNIALEYLLTA